jgi:hypothetical protein
MTNITSTPDGIKITPELALLQKEMTNLVSK